MRQYAVVTGSLVTNIITAEPDGLQQLISAGAFGSAQVLDLAGASPVPSIGWLRSGSGWTPPAASPSAPVDPSAPTTPAAPITPAEGTETLATVDDDDPLTIRLDSGAVYASPQVVRHAGYSPVKGDSVEAVWRQGAWIVRDAVVSTAS